MKELQSETYRGLRILKQLPHVYPHRKVTVENIPLSMHILTFQRPLYHNPWQIVLDIQTPCKHDNISINANMCKCMHMVNISMDVCKWVCINLHLVIVQKTSSQDQQLQWQLMLIICYNLPSFRGHTLQFASVQRADQRIRVKQFYLLKHNQPSIVAVPSHNDLCKRSDTAYLLWVVLL